MSYVIHDHIVSVLEGCHRNMVMSPQQAYLQVVVSATLVIYPARHAAEMKDISPKLGMLPETALVDLDMMSAAEMS